MYFSWTKISYWDWYYLDLIHCHDKYYRITSSPHQVYSDSLVRLEKDGLYRLTMACLTNHWHTDELIATPRRHVMLTFQLPVSDLNLLYYIHAVIYSFHLELNSTCSVRTHLQVSTLTGQEEMVDRLCHEGYEGNRHCQDNVLETGKSGGEVWQRPLTTRNKLKKKLLIRLY